MKITRDIRSLSDFKQNASKVIKQVKETGVPVVLTVNGKASVVLQDAESYEALVTAREVAESAAILKKRIEYVRSGGELIPADDVFRILSKKYGIKFD